MSLDQRVLEEIKTFFQNEFAITLTDLQKPTYIFVRDFYACVLNEFEVDTDNVRKASHLIDGMEYSPEITGDVNFVAAINHTLRFLNFGLFDLLSPAENQKRTVSLISSVMEFMDLSDELTTRLDFEGYRSKRDEVNQQLHELEAMREQLTDIALTKDRLVQATISMKNDVAKTKLREQELCTETAAVVKEANAAQMKLEERGTILKAKKAEADKLKNSINCLKGELMSAQSLDLKEEENHKVVQEKIELNNRYLEKVAAKKKYAIFVEAIKPFSAATDGISELLDENGIRKEDLLLIKKETAEHKQTLQTKKKELSWLQNEAEDLVKKLEQKKLDKTNIREELKKKLADQTKKSSEVIKTIQETKEEIAASDKDLDGLEKGFKQAEKMLIDYFQALKKEVGKHGL